MVVNHHLRKRKLADRIITDHSSMKKQQHDSSMKKQPHDSSSSGNIQFFIKTNNKTLVLHQNPHHTTIKSLHTKIHSLTGIPVSKQRLMYRSKHLHSEHTLSHYMITNDAELTLVYRMPSTVYPKLHQLIHSLISIIISLCKGGDLFTPDVCNKLKFILINKFFKPLKKVKKPSKLFPPPPAADYVNEFISSSAPEALVALYMSPYAGNKQCARDSILHFVNSVNKIDLDLSVYLEFEPLLLLFCKLLAKAATYDDPLYKACRTSLGFMVKDVKLAKNSVTFRGGVSYNDVAIFVKKFFPFVDQLATSLSKSVVNGCPSSSDIRDFVAFVRPLRDAIVDHVGVGTFELFQHNHKLLFYSDEINYLYFIFRNLMEKLQSGLSTVDGYIKVKKEKLIKGDVGWDQYLSILRELHYISQLYNGEEENFWMVLRHYKAAVCYLIVKYAKRDEDYKWIHDHKDVTDFESRRHLVMLLLPDVKNEYEDQLEMLIDRSNLLAESFEYISGAEPEKLLNGIFMEFKNEEATGPGVIREWLFLVCQAIFDPQNALFVACPNDRRRFSPNPASKVDPMHLKYFKFAGRVIALSMMHKVQVGIVFDRVFFLQLGGIKVCLEDIKDADPCLYNSCKQILDMDPCAVDDDVLGLTFVWEVEELGSMKVFELLPDGKHISVNSGNRKTYIDLIINHRFVTSIRQQVTEFATGFAEIVTNGEIQRLCFKSLLLEDLDGILHGSGSPISVDDWKAHTEYDGYKETDRQISWFWKIVGKMSAEQHKVLLCFWTSVKFLPVEGFRGLASRLCIIKSSEKVERLPSSHTCFYQLCFPAYPSMAVMKQRLNLITQEYVGSGFGTW